MRSESRAPLANAGAWMPSGGRPFHNDGRPDRQIAAVTISTFARMVCLRGQSLRKHALLETVARIARAFRPLSLRSAGMISSGGTGCGFRLLPAWEQASARLGVMVLHFRPPAACAEFTASGEETATPQEMVKMAGCDFHCVRLIRNSLDAIRGRLQLGSLTQTANSRARELV